jgi:hypothetical protein
MMKYYLLPFALLCLSSFQSFSRSSKHFSYLVATIHERKNIYSDKTYYEIEPEGGDTIPLVRYTERKRAKAVAPFYDPQNDTATVYFNYFTSISQALRYLDDRGWQLMTVISSIQNYDRQSSMWLSTSPVYYFKKERKEGGENK